MKLHIKLQWREISNGQENKVTQGQEEKLLHAVGEAINACFG